jgi:precorrin-6Y C5,15-methyltransferase (decarboxylating)
LKEILIFAGTTEGRELSERLSETGIAHTVCVATEYGELVLKDNPLLKVHRGRMDADEMKDFIRSGEFSAVVDATHPYAKNVTENLRAAMQNFDIPYLRLKRDTDIESDYDKTVFFENNESCAEALRKIEGNILLTTGSKELPLYCTDKELKSRLYVRILPGIESLNLCLKQGISGKQILALQGPFTTEMNEAMLRQYQIKCLVTKKSGDAGGYPEKIEAAKRVGIPVFVIGQKGKQEGYSFGEICKKLGDICGKEIPRNERCEIILAGVGMGGKGNMSGDVLKAIENADILLGSERLIEGYSPRFEKKPYYTAERIIPYLKKIKKKRVVVLFSGDSGFYSGCQALYRALMREIEAGSLDTDVCILPGISSVAYLAAYAKESYEDAGICSIHGRKLMNLAERIRHEKKTFLLMSGVCDVNRLGKLLVDAKLENCKVWVGYQLSYPKEEIKLLTPGECCKLKEEGLYTCLIINPTAEEKILTHGRADTEFIREKVPMTKEEVREVSICKLKLHKGAVVYDIGSGTGSIAVEIAGLSGAIQVYAIEQKEEAVALIDRNRDKFGLENIEIIKAKAPEGLLGLTAPTHAFIGGSGGNLKEILSVLHRMNPVMRVVINAVSMETICEIKEIVSLYPVEDEDIVQIQVSRSKPAGRYHMMQAENPVWICAFNFKEESLDEI